MKRFILTVAALGFVAPAVAQTANPAPVPSQVQKSQPSAPMAPKAKMDATKSDAKKTIKDKKVVKPGETSNSAKPTGTVKSKEKGATAKPNDVKKAPAQQVK